MRVLLIFVLLFLLFVFYLKFLWRKRDAIKKSWNFPGPINFPVIGAAYIFIGHPENVLNKFVKMHRQYPQGWKIWSFNHLFYCISEPEQIEKIFRSKKHIEKRFFYKHLIDAFGNGLAQAPGHIWRQHRKCINPSFSQTHLNSFVEVFWQKSLILSKILSQELNKEIDMFHLISRCTLDMIFQTSIGLNLNTQIGNRELPEIIEEVLTMLFFKTLPPWNQLPILWKISGYKELFDQQLKIGNNIIDQVIMEKMKIMEDNTKNTGKEKFAFLDCMIEQKFSLKEFRDEAVVFAVAGSDTTASSLTFLFTMFGLYPDIQQNVYEEVIQILGEYGVPQPNDLSKLVYTERVIKENLRLFPVVAMSSRYLIEDIDTGSFIIPKGATIHVPVFAIHRNPKYYPDPLKFDPNRFLPEEVKKRPPCVYLPFSYGPRDCIGKTYGMMNMKVIVASLIRNFVFHTNYKKFEDIKIKSNIVLKFRDGAKLWLTERK